MLASLLLNPEFAGDGIGGLSGWCTADTMTSKVVREVAAGPGGATAIRFERFRGVLLQTGFKLVPGEPYELSVWVRTSNLPENAGKFVVYNKGWSKELVCGPYPRDTKGRWIRLTGRIDRMFESSDRGVHNAAFYVRDLGGGTLEACGPSLVALSVRGDREAVRLPSQKPFPSRLVPIEPKLREVDGQNGRLVFYLQGEASPGQKAFAAADGQTVEGTFDDDKRVEFRLGAMEPGKRRLDVWILDADGKETVRDSYQIVVRPPVPDGPSGRRLNNFVTELLSARLRDGQARFFNPRSGWVYIALDGAGPETEARLDGAAVPVVRYRPGERFETMRWLEAGWKTLAISGCSPADGRLTVRAVCRIVNTTPRFDAGSSNLSRREYRFDFWKRYVLPFFNVASFYDWRRAGTDFQRQVNGYLSERGLRIESEVVMHATDPARESYETCFRKMTEGAFADRLDVTVDENGVSTPGVTRAGRVNFSEVAWRMGSRGVTVNACIVDSNDHCYAEPETQTSELSSIFNSGDGQGMLYLEVYPAALADEKSALRWREHYVGFRQSVTNLVPAGADALLYYFGTYIDMGHWNDYSQPEADYRVLITRYLHRLATDPAYGTIGGVGAGAFHHADDDIVRWISKAIRYYAVEGGTEDLAEKCGLPYLPGHLRNPDFAAGLSGWTVDGQIKAEVVKDFGARIQWRKKMPKGTGDGLAVFTRGESISRLSQRAAGLTPGEVYQLSWCIVDYDELMKPDSGGRLQPGLDVQMDGAAEIRELRGEVRIPQDAAWADMAKKCWPNDRFPGLVLRRVVFRAERAEPTLSFVDGNVSVGTRVGLNFINLRRYWHEGEEDLKWLVSHGGGGNLK